jgi:ankyrin repeat protein
LIGEHLSINNTNSTSFKALKALFEDLIYGKTLFLLNQKKLINKKWQIKYSFYSFIHLAHLMPELLENAIMQNDHAYVEQGLNQFDPVPANSVNEALQTSLMIACQHKSIEIAKVFLKKSKPVKNDDPSFCNVNLVDASGWTALHYATQSGSFECVKLLTEYKAKIDATTDKNETALFLATKQNHPDIVDLLAENIYQLETKALYNMPMDNLPEKDKSKDYSSEDDKTKGDKSEDDMSEDDRSEDDMSEDSEEEDNDFNALVFAVKQNFAEIAKCLLIHLTRRKKLDEELLNELLLTAAGEDHSKIAHELLINGADVNYKGSI